MPCIREFMSNSTETAPPSNQAEASGTFAALRIASFAWFISGTTLTNAAQWIQQVTLSWLVYDLTSSGAMLGTLNLVRSIATVGLAPLAGVAIDRLSRRGLLYGTSLWLCAISVGFGFVFWRHSSCSACHLSPLPSATRCGLHSCSWRWLASLR